MITFGDLYAGAGLFSYGFKLAGLTPKFAVELSADAAASYARNMGTPVFNGSVTELAQSASEVDVLIAGPPCQGFSTLGRRDPLDARNDLCLAVLPWVDKTKPKIVVIENVPPFLKSQHWRIMADGLALRGFDIETWELDAAEFGTPQTRHRAFTVASKIGAIAQPKPLRQKTTVRETIIDRKILPDDPMHSWPEPTDLASRRFKLIPERGDKRDILKADPESCPPSWKKMGCQATDVWGRIDADQPSNTLRCTFQNPSKGRYIHPFEDRVISLREGARLQGVPDDWQFAGKPYSVARQIGNGVPVPLAFAVANAIADGVKAAVRPAMEAA
ncbi:DNA cytosine methyltransferase [Agrobacterium salinitolerans]